MQRLQARNHSCWICSVSYKICSRHSETVDGKASVQINLNPMPTLKRQYKSILVGIVLLATAFAPDVRAQVIRLVSSPGKFYVDDKVTGGISNGIVFNYAAYT